MLGVGIHFDRDHLGDIEFRHIDTPVRVAFGPVPRCWLAVGAGAPTIRKPTGLQLIWIAVTLITIRLRLSAQSWTDREVTSS